MIGWLYVIIAFLTLAYIVHKSRSKGRVNLPPGPPPLPVIGNAHQLDYANMHETFDKWAKQYGEIVYSRVMDKTIIIFNSFDVAKEALLRQGDNFSARPEFYIFDVLTNGRGYVRSDGWVWKEQRRHGLHLLRDFGLGRNLQEEKIVAETVELFAEFDKNLRPSAEGTLSGTVSPISDLKFAVVNIINNILFGKRFPYGDEQFVRFQKLCNDVLYDTNRQFAMEFITLLRYFPWLFKQKECKQKFGELLEYYGDEVKQHQATLEDDLASGNPSDFVYAYLQEIQKRNKEDVETNSFTVHQLVQNLSDLFAAGFETTATTLSWFMLYMIHFPEIQAKMRAEIEDNIGQAPEWADRVKLPYTCAVIAEIQRHANIVPFGVFHSCFEEANVKGFHIPKNCIVVVNHWSIMRDEKLFPNPTDFKPERFIAADGSFSEKIDGFIPFSIGKRACMGESLARMELFLFATAIVMRYRLKPPDSGLPTMQPVCQFTLAPQPFNVKMEVEE